jgi:hypothetical protein
MFVFARANPSRLADSSFVCPGSSMQAKLITSDMVAANSLALFGVNIFKYRNCVAQSLAM